MMQQTLQTFLNLLIQYGTRLLGGLVVLIIGRLILGLMDNAFRRFLERKQIDPTLKPVIISTVSLLLKIALVLAAAATMGIETTSFVAILGSFGLAAGLALQGSLANVAGGFLLLFFRPIRVGDYIYAQDKEGFVREIQLLVTILETPDNITIYLPNGNLANGQITNFSAKGNLRINLSFRVDNDVPIEKVRGLLTEAMLQNPKVLKDPKPVVVVTKLDTTTEITMRPWCLPNDKRALAVELLEAAKKNFEEARIPPLKATNVV